MHFKLLSPEKIYVFLAEGYGEKCLSGKIEENGYSFRALLNEVENPETWQGKSLKVTVTKITTFAFFPVELALCPEK